MTLNISWQQWEGCGGLRSEVNTHVDAACFTTVIPVDNMHNNPHLTNKLW